ncbi:Bifunctional polynucleotide phosphatase/kinase [Neolecta irregularis DAH-3]|uniref:Bifunctional polynucleotide phosphatase/kinase n=1 Tax=Neolecta irregularis (strain DAH-3) TaxID=1198029 RepID=A0A1U7LVV6_NEOID|nr:Bifunctional polynucleotide phosphatase/kinase [Neolecta irregularis DAH-3]|eukprot:OLL26810.1 Bifunctional polynucleotide phosphatase/kinase [Neolecta irregularis DAH-3]
MASRRPQIRSSPSSPSKIRKPITINHSFFKPVSEKKTTSLVQWQERKHQTGLRNTLLVGKYLHDNIVQNLEETVKLATFDLDGTLIKTASGNLHSLDEYDWTWWDDSVPEKLRHFDSKGYRLIIFSNQNGIRLPGHPEFKRVAQYYQWKAKLDLILEDLNLPVTIYAATLTDNFRKPRIGMWESCLADIGRPVDKSGSYFVGDAAGRPQDHSCVDRKMAMNIGIKFFTPDEFFLGQTAQPYSLGEFCPSKHSPLNENPDFDRKNEKDIVLLVGMPGSGKSSFYRKVLKPLGYKRINQDTLKSRENCTKAALFELEKGNSVAIDNTNVDQSTRAVWIKLARTFNVPIRCIHLITSEPIARHNNLYRALSKVDQSVLSPSLLFKKAHFLEERRSNVPMVAYRHFRSRYQNPELSEGFQDIVVLDFEFSGTEEERKIWEMWWDDEPKSNFK